MDSPASTTTIGNLGIIPDAIDFRPLASGQTDPVLYGIDVGPTTTQLYTINKATAAVAPVGPGFPSQAGSYSLLNSTIGFDFNPRTLQADDSIRIRVVSSNGTNLRLNSNTGLIAAVDTALAFAGGTNSPFVDAVAYINNNAATTPAAGTTGLYDLDSRNDGVYFQNPPNSGTLNLVGPFGVTIDGNPNMAFDIFTDPLSVDDSLAGDRGLAVYQRTATEGGAYLLYDVDLANGQTTGGRLVGGGLDFAGGFAAEPQPIPEPSLCGLLAAGLAAASLRRRRNGAV